jgi:hypothetical protein
VALNTITITLDCYENMPFIVKQNRQPYSLVDVYNCKIDKGYGYGV